ncbi:MAG: SDR family oxidoreductase [Alphaproteobacteria bacterium]|nr:SDR family oxidoreductase [Alphaproteobacteria bacterium]
MTTKKTEQAVLITGAARRIGRAIALALAAKGWNIAVHFRNSEAEAAQLVADIEALGVRAVKLKADLSVAGDIDSLVPACCDRLSAPTCIINNASAFLPDSIPQLADGVWDEHLAINLKAPVFLAQALFQHLPDSTAGNVINIIDQRVWRLTPDFFSYTISKAGLWTATRTLAQSMAPRVRVNAVGPGPVLQSIHQSEAEFATEVRSTLLERAPTPEDIARAVMFILETPAMTGQMIALDSGQHLTWSTDTPG